MQSLKLGSSLVTRHKVGIMPTVGVRISKHPYFGKAGERFKFLLFRRIPEREDIITLLEN